VTSPLAAAETDAAEPASSPARATDAMSSADRVLIFASSLGTVFEWYDFFLVGALAPEISRQIFAGVNPTASFILTLLGFAAGFAVRPFGAVVFGRIGDLVGRKRTFLATIVLMGGATFAIGLLPTFAAIGIASPIGFVALRMVQGLALGGEYGGAVIYVAEHAPNRRRGAWTAWIQVTASVGLILSLGIILLLRFAIGQEAFGAWGWRLPFLFSLVLLAVSVWIRLKLDESPAFLRMKRHGHLARAPLSEAFGTWRNLRLVLIAFFGLAVGQAVIWYTGQFYSMFFLTQVLKADTLTANLLVATATVITIPFYVVFGTLSDRIGRKPLFVTGLVLGIAFFFPLFKALTHYVNPALEAAQRKSPIVVTAAPGECSFQFNPAGTAKFSSSCDVATASLTRAGMHYERVDAPAGTIARIGIGDAVVEAYDGARPDAKSRAAAFDKALADALKSAGYSAAWRPEGLDRPMAILVLTLLMLFGTMTYGPLGAMLVEMFPTHIRYTSLSLPYHVGIGWFGGFLPAIAFAIAAASGDIYAGLWYPVVAAIVSAILCVAFLRDRRGVDIYAME
jgi:MFS family permease